MDNNHGIADKLHELDRLEKHLFAINYAATNINVSGEIYDPPLACEARGEVLAILDTEAHKLLCSRELAELLDELDRADAQGLLDKDRQAQLRILKRDRASLIDIPADEAADFSRLTNEATDVWTRAKRSDDWASFEPFLERIVESMKRLASYKNPNKDPYDVWLNEYEYGSSKAFYDKLFSQLKDCIVPLVKEIEDRGWQPSKSCISGHFEHAKQLAFSRDLLALEGLNLDALAIAESEHPFSDSLVCEHNLVTTHIYEDELVSSLYSVLHEGGHASYEQGGNPAYNYCSLNGGTSMGIHESQSRFFENYVGRHEAFAPHILNLLERHFPGRFADVDPHDYYLAVNRVEPSLIRTEADELTYPLHVLIRYELEQMLFSGEAKASDVPRLWAELYERYLGVEVPSMSKGPLQDTHWSGGMLGYFPTYALGSAYGAQFLKAMKGDGVGFEATLRSGDLTPIRAWLKEHIWQFSRAKDPAELLGDATGQAFDASYFTRYLEHKFSEIYGLD